MGSWAQREQDSKKAKATPACGMGPGVHSGDFKEVGETEEEVRPWRKFAKEKAGRPVGGG